MPAERPLDPAALHRTLVDSLVEQQMITSPAVEAAFRAVRREHFLPDRPPEEVYKDDAIVTKLDESGQPISSSSQPAIMAIMLEQLDLRPGHHVLEIGAGTGYNAALLAHLVGEHGRVTTLDIDDDLVAAARANLAAAGFEQVQVIAGDGMRGYAPHAPYDRILLTVAGWDIPPEWLDQLTPDGRLVLPLSFYGPQLSIAFARQDGHLASRSVKSCGFMPLRGPHAEPLPKVQVGDRWEIHHIPQPDGAALQTDPEVLAAWLDAPYAQQPAGLELSGGELLFKWPLWAALVEPGRVLITRSGAAQAGDPVPDLFPPRGMTFGLLGASGLALLAEPPGAPPPEGDRFARTLPVHIRRFGPDPSVAARLREKLHAWDSAGRPPHAANMSVWALPVEQSPASLPADACLTRRWHTFCLRWGAAA